MFKLGNGYTHIADVVDDAKSSFVLDNISNDICADLPNKIKKDNKFKWGYKDKKRLNNGIHVVQSDHLQSVFDASNLQACPQNSLVVVSDSKRIGSTEVKSIQNNDGSYKIKKISWLSNWLSKMKAGKRSIFSVFSSESIQQSFKAIQRNVSQNSVTEVQNTNEKKIFDRIFDISGDIIKCKSGKYKCKEFNFNFNDKYYNVFISLIK